MCSQEGCVQLCMMQHVCAAVHDAACVASRDIACMASRDMACIAGRDTVCTVHTAQQHSMHSYM